MIMSKILVVEDEKSLRLFYKEDLEQNGYEVQTVGSAAEGLRVFEADWPDLVVLDIRLPGMDGLDAMGRMLNKNPRVPIVLNTGYSSYKDNFLSWAADAYVIKSSNTEELRAKIRESSTRASSGFEGPTPDERHFPRSRSSGSDRTPPRHGRGPGALPQGPQVAGCSSSLGAYESAPCDDGGRGGSHCRATSPRQGIRALWSWYGRTSRWRKAPAVSSTRSVLLLHHERSRDPSAPRLQRANNRHDGSPCGTRQVLHTLTMNARSSRSARPIVPVVRSRGRSPAGWFVHRTEAEVGHGC